MMYAEGVQAPINQSFYLHNRKNLNFYAARHMIARELHQEHGLVNH